MHTTLIKLLLVACLATTAFCQIRLETPEEMEARRMAENARYSFSSDVEDSISDLTHHRQETRDGLNLKGSYSYSDGYQRRVVDYTADQFGYHIVGERVENLPGPSPNPRGTASVSTNLHDGSRVRYRIQSVPELRRR